MSLYEIIQDIVRELRNGSDDFKSMISRLVESGMSEEEADKMLDRLMQQIEEE